MQATNNILLIRPAKFGFNTQTESSNAFQNKVDETPEELIKKVNKEFELFASTLISKGINVLIINDTEFPAKPDAIFPNNWISFHSDGTVVLYPMNAVNRQAERRLDILEKLKEQYLISRILDFSHFEKQNKFLEGTGSIIFDHDNKIAYACISTRTNKELFLNVCEQLYYNAICFSSYDENGMEIYHTNVMMCIAEKFAVICLESITDKIERDFVIKSLESSGHTIIEISLDQVKNFAGNMLELKNLTGKSYLVMSASADDSLTQLQKDSIIKFSEIVPLNVSTIENTGGGSVRCMIAEVFLPNL
ncbi:MAG: arginine deiminase-related protein [Ferruginibacter sp.]